MVVLLYFDFIGCFCPDGLVRIGDKCVLPTECPNSPCLLPADIGSGRYCT